MRTVDERHVSIWAKRCLCTQKAFEPQPAQHLFRVLVVNSLHFMAKHLRHQDTKTQR
jgi:hypothetical protein